MPNFSNAPIADEYAIFDTNYGQFKVRLLGSKAPITVKNFDYLVKKVSIMVLHSTALSKAL